MCVETTVDQCLPYVGAEYYRRWKRRSRVCVAAGPVSCLQNMRTFLSRWIAVTDGGCAGTLQACSCQSDYEFTAEAVHRGCYCAPDVYLYFQPSRAYLWCFRNLNREQQRRAEDLRLCAGKSHSSWTLLAETSLQQTRSFLDYSKIHYI